MEKWQEALKRWSAWEDSISGARRDVKKEHADIDIGELMSRSTFESKECDKGDHISARIKTNAAMAVAWDIDSRLLERATRFVSNEIGLRPDSNLHYLFVDHWMHRAFPEFRGNVTTDTYYWEQNVPPNRTWAEYKIINAGTADEDIEHVVHWRQSKVKPSEVAKRISRAKWPSSPKQLPRKDKGGRPKGSEIPAEAVVCSLLKHRTKMEHKEIAALFGWNTYTDSNGNLMSNTARSRIKLGDRILENEGEQPIPTNN